MRRKAQFMPQAIHESTAFHSCNRKVAIHCVFSVKENTHTHSGFLCVWKTVYMPDVLPRGGR